LASFNTISKTVYINIQMISRFT